jgi:hypothetical protein
MVVAPAEREIGDESTTIDTGARAKFGFAHDRGSLPS